MAEIDMIPRSYHDAMRLQASLKVFGLALGTLLMVSLIGFGVLRWRIAVAAPMVANLRSATEQSEAGGRQLAQARQQKIMLEQKLAALTALRGAGEVARVARAIDQSLNRGVWFKELRFTRDEQLLPPGPAAPAQTGYFLVLPAASSASSSATSAQTWRLSKNIEINGAAVDHAALTDFLRSLATQPSVAEVHFINSNVRVTDGVPVIDFNVIAATRAQSEAPP